MSLSLTTREALLQYRKRRSQIEKGSACHSGAGVFEEGSHPPSALWRSLIPPLPVVRLPQGRLSLGPPLWPRGSAGLLIPRRRARQWVCPCCCPCCCCQHLCRLVSGQDLLALPRVMGDREASPPPHPPRVCVQVSGEGVCWGSQPGLPPTTSNGLGWSHSPGSPTPLTLLPTPHLQRGTHSQRASHTTGHTSAHG